MYINGEKFLLYSNKQKKKERKNTISNYFQNRRFQTYVIQNIEHKLTVFIHKFKTIYIREDHKYEYKYTKETNLFPLNTHVISLTNWKKH